MPAMTEAFDWKRIRQAALLVGEGLRRVDGEGWSCYRIGPTIRLDLKPLWTDPVEEEHSTRGSLGPILVSPGDAEAHAEALFKQGELTPGDCDPHWPHGIPLPGVDREEP